MIQFGGLLKAILHKLTFRTHLHFGAKGTPVTSFTVVKNSNEDIGKHIQTSLKAVFFEALSV